MEIAFLGIMGGEGVCVWQKLSQKAPGNQMASSMLDFTHTFIKDYCGFLWIIVLEVWGHKELENCSQLQLNPSYF